MVSRIRAQAAPLRMPSTSSAQSPARTTSTTIAITIATDLRVAGSTPPVELPLRLSCAAVRPPSSRPSTAPSSQVAVAAHQSIAALLTVAGRDGRPGAAG